MTLIEHKPTILVIDFRASEAGSLSIIEDLYNQASNHNETSNWIFMVGTPHFNAVENISVSRDPLLKKRLLYRIFYQNVMLPRRIRKINPDIVLNLQNQPLKTGSIKQIVYLHLPFILTEHKLRLFRDGLRLWFYQNVYRYIILRKLRTTSKIIVQTTWMKKALTQVGIEESKILIVAPAINLDDISITKLKQDFIEQKHVFIYPATAFTYKNHKIIIEALKVLPDEIRDSISVIFTVSGYENRHFKKLKLEVEGHNLPINFKGMISREHVFQILSSGNLIFPSIIESFGLPLLEARMLGRPVIAANTDFAHEILANYELAKFFSYDDHYQLAECIKQLAKSKKIKANPKTTICRQSKIDSLSDIIIKELSS